MGSVDHWCGHFLCWHTGDSQTVEVVVAPLLARLIGHAIHLTLHTFGSLALAFLAEEHDGMGIGKVDLNTVVGVLDGSDGHGWCPLR